ncbi:MAG TPA: ATP-binding protein, partial [Bryobacteraceae bacterium]|nr:ATP-binding protein [Bryobacteraceae bacterium]
PAASSGQNGSFADDWRLSLDDERSGPLGAALRAKEHHVCNDITADPVNIPLRDEALRRGFRSAGIFPITTRGELAGAMTVYGDKPGTFDRTTIALFDEVTLDVSFALESIEQEGQRKAAERTLRRQAEILDQVHDAIISTDINGQIATWNKGADRLYGYNATEAVGRHISLVFPHKDLESIQREVIEPLQANGTHELELRLRRKSGEHFYAHLSLSLLREENGMPVGVIGYALDITQRKMAESEVRRLNAALEQRITERTAQLADANNQLAERNKQLAQASRMKSEFLARMSHELRTPLNSIAGFSELLAEADEGPLSQTYSDYVRHVHEGAQHLMALLNDILDLSRIEAGRIELRSEIFAAGEAISDVLSVTSALAEAKRIDLKSEVSTQLHVIGDPVRFKQILYNLISNAVKFTPAGGSARVAAQTYDGGLRFSVSDTGIGIPREEHDSIFREFHQLGPPTTGRDGSGLGLSITKRLVELHGGRIWVESAPGEGSRFYFTMPAAHAGDHTAPKPDSWRQGAG